MRRRVAALVLGLACPALAGEKAEPPVPSYLRPLQDELLDHLVGSWQLSGTMGKHELRQGCTGAWVLNHQFVLLHCRETKDPPVLGLPYEVDMYVGFDSSRQVYVAHLLDVFGQGAPTLGHARPSGRSLVFTFEEPDGLVENSMAWDASAGAWHVIIRQLRGGEWTVFAEKELRPGL